MRGVLVTAFALAAIVGSRAAAQPADSEAVAYHLERKPADALGYTFTDVQFGVLEKLNRADRSHLSRLPVLVVPDRWPDDERAYSPLPLTYPSAAGLPKAFLVHVPAQVFGAYEHGELVRWGPVSTGRAATPTPAGLYALNWKSPGRHSTVNPDWFMAWYFNFDSRDGLALHMYSLPGLPASHGCIRLLARDAVWLYGWGDGWSLDAGGHIARSGTPTWVLGAYDFRAPPPWRVPEQLATPLALPPFPARED